ncbi:MAG TPA: hypothetical protein VM869_07175 [Enhygromyxa sp.]|nr:hypothetical protein [Enhygromyxa sp.]
MRDANKLDANLCFALWNGGLIWGAILLLLAAGLFGLLLPDLRAATREVAVLSPATIDAIDLDEHRGELVEISGFTPDCEAMRFDGARMLVPAWSPQRESAILIALEYGSECSAYDGEFRGVATRWASRSRMELIARATWDLGGSELAVIEPSWSPKRALMLALGLLGLGVFGIASAFVRRKRLLAELHANTQPRVEPVAPTLADPYRPGRADRLITESLQPSLATLAQLRRKRALLTGLGLALLSAALLSASVGGWWIYEHERTWAIGVEASDAHPDGDSERVGLGLIRTEVSVAYVDQAGRHHRERTLVRSLLFKPDLSVVPQVRYRPEQPERFAVSWVHEQRAGSLLLLVLVSAALSGGGLVMLSTARRDRTHERTAAVFDGVREALLDLVHIDSRNNLTGSDILTYHFRVRDSLRRCAVEVGPRRPAPLFLDARETVGLALYNPDDREFLLVLSEDLHELERPPFTAAQLRGRYRANPELAKPNVHRRPR